MSKARATKKKRKRKSRTHEQRKRYEVRKGATTVHTFVLRIPRVIINPGKTWMVARIAPRLEAQTAFGMAYCGIEPYLPAVGYRDVRRGRVVTGERNPLPGYIFAGVERGQPCADRLWEFHNRELAQGFTGPFLGVFGPIRARELQRLADRIADEPYYEAWKPSTLVVGQHAIVRDGPFASFPAVISEMLENGCVKAEVTIFGRSTPVEFEPRQLEAA